MKWKQRIILIGCCILLAGCPKSKQLEEMGIVIANGIDVAEDDKIELTLVIFQFEAQSQNIAKVITGKADTIKGAVTNANYETNFVLDAGKLELQLYGKEIAKKGIKRYLDEVVRDASLPNSTYIAVSDTTGREIIEVQTEGISINIGQFLQQVIEENSNDNLFPRVSLSEFDRILYDVGQDPIAPLFSLKEGVPKITGIALFKDDKYVGKMDIDYKTLLNLTEKKIRQQYIEVVLPLEPFEKYINKKRDESDDSLNTSYTILKSKPKTRLVDKDKLHFETKVDMELSLTETSEQFDLHDKKTLRLLEKEVEKKLTAKYEKMFQLFQEYKVDPIGYGAIYRKYKRDGKLKDEEWREKLADVQVKYKVNVRIVNHGELY